MKLMIIPKIRETAQGSSRHTHGVGFRFTIFVWFLWFQFLHIICTDGQQKCKQVTIPTDHYTDGQKNANTDK
jgi:hypothetical protein